LNIVEGPFDHLSETTRLVIRPLRDEDYANWLHEFESRAPSLHQHDPGKLDMSECTPEWFEQLVERHQELARTDKVYIFGVFGKEDGTHLGMIDIATLAREPFQWASFGYTIHNQHWRKGYGKEAVSEVLRIAAEILKFHRLEAHINLDNHASIKLAESAGLQFECVRKGFIYEHEEWVDHLVYYKNL
jgi:RimJ/RimL family protein N-acetyltransferase